VDELGDDDRLAQTGAAEEADLASLGKGADEVDDLDTRLEDLRRRALLAQRRSGPVDRPNLLGLGRAPLVDRPAQEVEDAPERAAPYRHLDRSARIHHRHPTHEAVR